MRGRKGLDLDRRVIWGGTKRNRGRGTCNQNILNEKLKSIFNRRKTKPKYNHVVSCLDIWDQCQAAAEPPCQREDTGGPGCAEAQLGARNKTLGILRRSRGWACQVCCSQRPAGSFCVYTSILVKDSLGLGWKHEENDCFGCLYCAAERNDKGKFNECFIFIKHTNESC